MNNKIYQKLIDWLNLAWFGLPDSPHLMDTIKAVYSVEEAELLTGLPHKGAYLSEIADLKNLPQKKLLPKLDAMAQKGLVWKNFKNGKPRFSINDAFFVFMRSLFWPENKSKAAQEGAHFINQYFSDGFMEQFSHAEHKGLRTVPIHKTISDSRTLLPYEDVIKLVEDRSYYMVSDCPCRSKMHLDPEADACDAPLEVCLHFDHLGRYIVENRMGREITKEKTLKILKQAADSGLVHAVSNWKKDPDTICNCCSCCCLFFMAYHQLDHHKSVDPSRYTVSVSAQTCKACGLCVEKCPMDALALNHHPLAKNKKSMAPMAENEKCLGCGICVYTCTTGSLVLNLSKKQSEPPETAGEWVRSFFKDKKSGAKYKKTKKR